MINFEAWVETLIKPTTWAALVTVTGVIWQRGYAIIKDRAADREAKRLHAFEAMKFEHQKTIEDQKFAYQQALESARFVYEQRKWRVQLGVQLALKSVEARLIEYPAIWSEVRAVARHNEKSAVLTPASAQQVANAIESWRYSRGGLLADEFTRNAALAFQTVLWDYNGTPEAFKNIRKARKLLRAGLRADIGLGVDTLGRSLFDKQDELNKFEEELATLMTSLGIAHEHGIR